LNCWLPDLRKPFGGFHPRTFLMLSLRRGRVRPVTGRTPRKSLCGRLLLGSTGGESEASGDDPRRRCRNRRITNAVKPIQAKAAPKIRSTAGIVSMTKFRRGTVGGPYRFPGAWPILGA
jgi:hypothetical protein